MVIRRGDVFLAKLGSEEEPAAGSEQKGARPVIVVSRDAINASSPVVIVVPVTDRANKKKIYPSQVVLKAGDGGLKKDSVALGEQVRAISTAKLVEQWGHLAPPTMVAIGAALKAALDL